MFDAIRLGIAGACCWYGERAGRVMKMDYKYFLSEYHNFKLDFNELNNLALQAVCTVALCNTCHTL